MIRWHLVTSNALPAFRHNGLCGGFGFTHRKACRLTRFSGFRSAGGMQVMMRRDENPAGAKETQGPARPSMLAD